MDYKYKLIKTSSLLKYRMYCSREFTLFACHKYFFFSFCFSFFFFRTLSFEIKTSFWAILVPIYLLVICIASFSNWQCITNIQQNTITNRLDYMYNMHRYGRWTGGLMLSNLPGIQRRNKMLIRIPHLIKNISDQNCLIKL